LIFIFCVLFVSANLGPNPSSASIILNVNHAKDFLLQFNIYKFASHTVEIFFSSITTILCQSNVEYIMKY